MNKYLLLEWISNDFERNLEHYYPSKVIEDLKLQDALYELNNRREVNFPSSLPKKPEQMIPVLREHFKDEVTFISLILNYHFPERYFFYRVSKLEPEIFLGFQFFSEIIPDFSFDFDRVGKRGFKRYLELNERFIKFTHKIWPKLKKPQRHLAYLLYQGFGDLFLEKSDYNRYWVVATQEQYFEDLDAKKKEVDWSGRKEMQPGDLVFVYRTAPRKAITDILKVKDHPTFDPWGAWDGFWIFLEKVCSIEDISIAKMREDKTLGQWGLVRRNFVGTVTEPIPHSVYNGLLENIPEATRKKYKLEPEPVVETGRPEFFASEAEFEEKVVEPLLKRWGFKYEPQYSCRFCVGSQYFGGRIDFFVSDKSGPLTLFENKFRIISEERDLKPAVDQGKSYALMLGLSSFVVASPEGMWLYALNKNKEQLVKRISADELSNQKQEEEFRNLLLKLRG